MSLAIRKALGALGGTQLYVDDVFSTYLRTGTGAEQTITTGVDLSTRGGVVHSKSRSAATDHSLHATVLGTTYDLVTNSTAAMTNEAQSLKSVSTTGHTWGTLAKVNTNAATYVDWVFADAPNFHKTAVVTKSAGSNATVDLSSLGTVGMVRVRRAEVGQTGSWYIWHRSLSAGKLLIGETTAAEATLGHITVSGTTVTLVDGVIANGTYLVEAFAHDTSATGIIQCGSFTTDGSGNATVNLGWEIQYVTIKTINTVENWKTVDSMRGMPVGSNDQQLYPNLSDAEAAAATLSPTAGGFDATGLTASKTYIYLAIRRPNKPPTSGTQVYNAIARTGTGAAATVTGVGFAPDALFTHVRNSSTKVHSVFDRLRGAPRFLRPTDTGAEVSADTDVFKTFDMNGVTLGTDVADNGTNFSGIDYINWFLRRTPGVFDVVCHTSNGSPTQQVNHSLGVVPELAIIKSRNGTRDWFVWHKDLTAGKNLLLNSTAGETTSNATTPAAFTASYYTPGNNGALSGGANAETYVAYLFATLPGISKVGSYTGNGTSQTINCGFSAGARFVLIKRTDSTGDWYVWDSVRGIVAGNDPHLSLNTTAAEVTTDDSIDPDNSGFIVNQLAATNVNVNSATYVYLSFS